MTFTASAAGPSKERRNERALKTEIIAVRAGSPQPAAIARAAEILRHGGLVAFPTETVYGLGANALDPQAVAKVFAAKGRPANNPVIVHVAQADQVREIVADWPEPAMRLAARFWPGPLTLVLSKHPALPDIVTAGGPTVAVRMPAHPVALALIRAAGLPVAAPSANRSSLLSPTLAAHVLRGLDGRIDMVLDGGPTPGGLESTVLDLTSSVPRLLRPGLISPNAIEEVIGAIARSTPARPADERPLPAPGMLSRHYAPRAALECAGDDAWDRVKKLAGNGVRVGWLAFDAPEGLVTAGVTVIIMPRDAQSYAARFYAALHELDAAGVERIVASLPPDTEDWLAVRDRLRRASSNWQGESEPEA
jgi:L-threonylcarbamoyladenylate synthase